MKSILPFALLFTASALSAQSTKIGDFHLDKEYKMGETGTLYLNASDAKVFITGSKRLQPISRLIAKLPLRE